MTESYELVVKVDQMKTELEKILQSESLSAKARENLNSAWRSLYDAELEMKIE